MDDQEDDDFDVDRVEEVKGNSDAVDAINHKSKKNRSAYMREYRRRAKVIKKEGVRLKLRSELSREKTNHDFYDVA